MGASGSVIQQLNDVINEPGFFFHLFTLQAIAY